MEYLKVQIMFYDYLSFHLQLNKFTTIKSLIIKRYLLSENQFEKLLWRANRILMYQREFDIVKQNTSDNMILLKVKDNIDRQNNYFIQEIEEVLNSNGIPLKSDKNSTIKIKWKDAQKALQNALYPLKNPEIDVTVIGNRYFNSGTYFIDNCEYESIYSTKKL